MFFNTFFYSETNCLNYKLSFENKVLDYVKIQNDLFVYIYNLIF